MALETVGSSPIFHPTQKGFGENRPKPINKFNTNNIGVSSSGKTQHFDCCIRRFVEAVQKLRQTFGTAKSRAVSFFSVTLEVFEKSHSAEYPATPARKSIDFVGAFFNEIRSCGTSEISSI